MMSSHNKLYCLYLVSTLYILLLSEIPLIMAQTTSSQTSSNKVIFFNGNDSNTYKSNLISSFHIAMECYRKFISKSMADYEHIIKLMQHNEDTHISTRNHQNFHILKQIHTKFQERIYNIPMLAEVNEMNIYKYIDFDAIDFKLLLPDINMINHDNYDIKVIQNMKSKSNDVSYNNFEQLLIHLNRDWGKDGYQMRQRIYRQKIIKEILLSYYHDHNNRRIFLPGAGMSRLGLEISSYGFR